MVLTHAGDDAITIDGSGDKTIDGVTGTDSLTIDLAGHTTLTDFAISYSNGEFTFTDQASNTLRLKNLENYTIGSNSYVQWDDTAINSGDGGASNSFWGTTEKLLYGYSGGIFYAQKLTNAGSNFTGMSSSDNLNYVGNDGQQTLNLNIDRTSYTGIFDISLGGGNDNINSAKFVNNDSLDAGAGDDTIYIMVGGGSGTPSFGDLNMTKLDGGAVTDTLAFEESTTGGAEINLSLGGAVNFENLIGTSAGEVVRGDTGNNVLSGKGGADTIYGGNGNDTIYADSLSELNGSATASSASTNDELYGEVGDDTLVGSAGDNTLDGGTGADTLITGNGSDTIIIRAGDGGSDEASADTITDFTDGTDVLGLAGGLQYSQLTIDQGSGDYANDTLVSITSTSEYLTVLQGISASHVTEEDFQPLPIA